MDHKAGWLLGRRYRLLNQLSRDDEGRVWRARDELIDRDVTVEEMRGDPDDTSAGPDSALRTAAAIRHPGVAQIYDVLSEDERVWVVREYIAGATLDEVIAVRPLAAGRVAAMGVRILLALKVVHDKGLAFRDLSPRNVLLADDGRVLLVDFAAAARAIGTPLSRTARQAAVPGHLAPEVADGGVVDPIADLWGLGATLCRAATGRPPTETPSDLPLIVGDEVVIADASYVPAAGLVAAIHGLLTRDPAERLTAVAAIAYLQHTATTLAPAHGVPYEGRGHSAHTAGHVAVARTAAIPFPFGRLRFTTDGLRERLAAWWRRPAETSGQVPVERMGGGAAMLYGAAHLLDFGGTLAGRPAATTLEEDMAAAWRDVGGVFDLAEPEPPSRTP